MTELELKKICWTYLIENGKLTDGSWSFYGGGWEHQDPKKQWDWKSWEQDRKDFITKIKTIGVNWEATLIPHFDVRSEFTDTFSDPADTRTMIGTISLKDGSSYQVGCTDQPAYLEGLADELSKIHKLQESANNLFD